MGLRSDWRCRRGRWRGERRQPSFGRCRSRVVRFWPSAWHCVSLVRQYRSQRFARAPACERDRQLDGDGDRDGFRNTSLRGAASWQPSGSIKLTLNGFHLAGRSQFDGLDPVTYLRADTRDQSRNRLSAGRVAVDLGTADGDWSGYLSASALGSRNRNLLAGAEQNFTLGSRINLDSQLNRRF